MNNKTFIACLIALFGLAYSANATAQAQQPIKLPPQGVVNSIQDANILISLDVSGSMGWRNGRGITPGDEAVSAIQKIVSKFGPIANFGLVRWSSDHEQWWRWPYFTSQFGIANDPFAHPWMRDVFRFTNDPSAPLIPITTNSKQSNNRILIAAQDYDRFGKGREFGNGTFRWLGGTNVADYALGFPKKYFTTGAGRSLTGQQCSKTIVILISDGMWEEYYNPRTNPSGMRPLGLRADADAAAITARELAAMGVMTVVLGLAEKGIPDFNQRVQDYRKVSLAGGGGEPLFAANESEMVQALTDKLSTILAESFSATSPVVMSSQQFGDLIFQPTFEYRNQGQWRGSLKAYSLNTTNMDATLRWDFGQQLQRFTPAARRLWTVAPGLPSPNASQNSNFNEGFANQLRIPMGGLTPDVIRSTINFVRGVDVFDDNRNGQRGEARHMLGDIFHSKPVFVGPPQAMDETDTDQIGVFGHFDNLRQGAHKEFVNAQRGRRPIVLAASNSGVLHAVDATVGLPNSGTEVWGFVPPPILNKLQLMNPTSIGGTSQARYMIDGNITVREVFINNNWRTYAAFGYGLGARAFTVIDITNVESPTHVLSIEHEFTGNGRRIIVWDQNGFSTVPNQWDRNGRIIGNYDPAFAEYRQLGYSTSAPIVTFNRNSAGGYAPVLVIGAGTIRHPPAMELETVGGTRRPSTGNAVFMVGLDGTVGRLLRTVPLNNPASLYSGCTNINCPVPYNQQVADIEVIEGGGSSNMKGAYGFELFIPNYSGSIQALNLSAATPGTLNTTVNPRAVFDPGTTVTNVNDQVITVPISISGLTHERTDGRLNITFGTGDMLNLSMLGKNPTNKVYSLQGNESNIVNGREVFSVNDLVRVGNGGTACPMPPGRRGWQLDVNNLRTTARTATGTSTTIGFERGKVAAKITQYGGSTVVPLYKPRTDNQCSIGDSGIYLFDSVCGNTRQSQAFSNAMIGGVSIIGDTLVIGISGGSGRANLSTGDNNFQKIDNLIIGRGVFDTNNTGSGKGTATIYNKQQVR